MISSKLVASWLLKFFIILKLRAFDQLNLKHHVVMIKLCAVRSSCDVALDTCHFYKDSAVRRAFGRRVQADRGMKISSQKSWSNALGPGLGMGRFGKENSTHF